MVISKTIAVAGDIEKSDSLSKLQKLGYQVTPLHSADGEIDILFVLESDNPENAYTDQAKIVWFAEGQTNTNVKDKAEANGQIVVENKCPFNEADRLRRGE